MIRKSHLLLMWVIGLSLCANTLYAQKVALKGTVKDDTGEALIGAAVYIKGTNTGVVTDLEGKYSIDVDAGKILVFAYVSCVSQEHKVTTGKTVLDVVLESNTQLEDVVVIGYGSGKRLGTITGSTVKLSSKDITATPTANVLEALQGKVAGLAINPTSGSPGSAPIVLLHGLGTLTDVGGYATDSTPLYVVDGLPVDAELVGSLNADDFESVTVLKDASATSIYGARAAYGVIYITTKRGRYEQPTDVSVSSQFGFSQIASDRFYRNLLNAKEYMDFMVELGNLDRDKANDILSLYKGDTRWDKIYFKRGSMTSQTNVSVSGGGKKTSFYFSGGYFNQDGVRYGSGYKRYSLRSNINTHINDWLSAGLSLTLGHSASTSNGGERGDLGGVMALPIYEAYDEEGNLVDYVQTLMGNRFYLPQYTASKLLSSNGSTNVVPNFQVTITPIPNLTLKSQAGLQYSFGQGVNKELPSYDANGGVGRVTRSTSATLNETITNTLEYKFNLAGRHHFTALLGQESVMNHNDYNSASSSGQVADALTTLSQGKNEMRVADGKDVSTYNSVFSRLDYAFRDRYFADVSLRRDGSSTFGKNNRYAMFWSAGIMWNIKHEAFLKDVAPIDELRVKFSTGTSGSRGGAGSYGSYSRLNFGQYAKQTTYHISQLGNPDLRWEKQIKTTVGLSLGLFDRVRMDLDVYERIIQDMFFTEPLPMITGFNLRPTNLAKLRSRGTDLTLSVTAYRDLSKNISIVPYLNLNYNEMRVLELATGTQQIPETPFGTGYAVNSPLMLFAPLFKGVNPDNGNPEWYIPNKDKMKTTRDDAQVTSKFDYATLNQNTGKKAYAPWHGGFGLNASYQGLSLQVGFAFSAGKYQANRDRVNTESNAPLAYNVSREALDFWKEPGQHARNPRKGVQFTRLDSRLIEDASFIRLKNVNLGYTLPKQLVDKTHFFKQMRVFVTGRNLLTFTKYTGADPEFNVILSSGGYPSTREYTMGVDFKF